MRGSGELVDNLRALIERWLHRVEIVRAEVGFVPVGEAASLVPAVEAPCVALEPQVGTVLVADPGVPAEARAVPIPDARDCPVAADGIVFALEETAGEAIGIALEEVREVPAALGEARSEGVGPAIGPLGASFAVSASLPPVRSCAVGRTTLPPARSFRRASEFERPRTTRSDGSAASVAVVRSRTEGPLGAKAAGRAMRALVETSGLPPSSLEWIGVFDQVPASPPSRLTVDADGKRIRLWYPEGARATGVHRIAAARIRGSGRVHAAVVAPE